MGIVEANFTHKLFKDKNFPNYGIYIFKKVRKSQWISLAQLSTNTNHIVCSQHIFAPNVRRILF